MRLQLFTFLLLALCFGDGYASKLKKPLAVEREKTDITGKVINEKGETMVGVSIKIKGTSSGTITGVNGTFQISANKSDVLMITYIGYKPKQVTIGEPGPLIITLDPEDNLMDEVVVVGYGTQRKANLTGSVATVDFKNLENIPQASTVNILSGRLPGLAVVQGSAQPGRDAGDLTIRGIGSLEGSSSPLIVIDGVQATIGDLSNLSPQEIDNVTILKDAASAAIYGSRGGNGVLLVTTKLPATEKISINFNSYTALQQATYLPEFVEGWQWVELQKRSTGAVPRPGMLDSLKAGLYSDNLANTKWFEEIFHTAPMHNFNLSASGKSKTTSFIMSAGYLTQQGILRGTSTQRYNLRGNIKSDLSKSVTAGLNIWGYKSKIKAPYQNVNGIIQDASRNPILPVYYANGDYAVFTDYINNTQGVANPLLRTTIGHSDDDNYKINFQPNITVKLFKGLKFNTSFAYSINNTSTFQFNPTYTYNNQYGMPSYTNLISSLDNISKTNTQAQVQSTLNYNLKLGKSSTFSALLGYEYVNNYSKLFAAHGEQLPSNLLPVLDNAIANLALTGNEGGYRLQSFFSRANYAYKNKYLIEANIRYDGSSVVGGNYRASPSASLGWVLSNEKFLQDSKLISFLKLRIGYGALGNDQGIGNYTFLQTLSLNNFYNIGGTLQTGSAIVAFANPNINWERTVSKNVGVDLGVFSNKLTLNLDLYNRLTDGILYRVPNPLSFGNASAPVLNLAEVSNKGIELNISHSNKIGKVNYTINGNLSYNKNKVEKLAGQRVILTDKGGSTIIQEGSSIQSWFGFVQDGLYTQEDEDVHYPKFNSAAVVVGSLKFKDLNNDGKIDDLDRTVLGDGNTPYTFGLSGNISYKQFDLSFLAQGLTGKDIYIYDFGNRPGNDGTTNFWKEWYTRAYEPESNPTGDWPIVKRQSPEVAASSSFWIANASYIRLKNVELGYSLPKKVTSKVSLTNLRLYASAQNLATFSSVPTNLDPERSNFAKNNAGYPQTKIFSFGLNASF